MIGRKDRMENGFSVEPGQVLAVLSEMAKSDRTLAAQIEAAAYKVAAINQQKELAALRDDAGD